MTTLRVIGPKPVVKAPCPLCIQHLEELLAEAKAGDVQEIAIAYLTGSGTAGSRFVHSGNLHLQGVVSRLAHRLNLAGDAT